MTVYVIEIEDLERGYKSILHVGYSTIGGAIASIKGKSEEIVDCGNNNYRDAEYKTGYTIRPVTII